MSGLSNVFDWNFFWGVFGMLFKTVGPFVLIIVAIYGVGILLKMVIAAVRQGK